MSKVRAMDKLARETARHCCEVLMRDVRLAINNGIKHDPALRSLGVSEREAWALTTVTLKMITTDVLKAQGASNE